MYRIDLIGAMVYDQNGDSIGLVTSIEDRAEGSCVNITNGEEPKVKVDLPDQGSNFPKFRDVKKEV